MARQWRCTLRAEIDFLCFVSRSFYVPSLNRNVQSVQLAHSYKLYSASYHACPAMRVLLLRVALRLFAVCVLCGTSAAQCDCDTSSNIAALLALRTKLNLSAVWDRPATSLCTWRLVSCVDSKVIALTLDGVASGNLSSATFADLPSLSVLRLSNNPLVYGTLSQLVLPSSLHELRLSRSGVSGTLPAVWGTQLPQLRILDLAFTSAVGSLPSEWSGFGATMVSLSVSNNRRINGSLPPSWGSSFAVLKSLDLSRTNVTGTVPQQWSFGPALYSVELQDCLLYGRLPDAWFGGDRINLNLMNVSHNNFSGMLPALPGNVELVDVSHNALSGTLPDLSLSRALRVVDASHNNFSGGPPRFCPPLLVSLNVAFNRLNGSVSDLMLVPSLSLSLIDMSHNRLFGTLDRMFSSASDPSTSSWTLRLQHNMLSGTLPESWGMQALSSLDVAHNALVLPLPLWNATATLGLLNASGNAFSGPIGTVLPSPFSLLVLDLSNASITSVALLDASLALQWLDVSFNKLTALPSALPGLIRVVRFSYNRLSAQLPAHWGAHNWRLQEISLDGNRALSGTIPQEWAALLLVRLVNLSLTNISGRLTVQDWCPLLFPTPTLTLGLLGCRMTPRNSHIAQDLENTSSVDSWLRGWCLSATRRATPTAAVTVTEERMTSRSASGATRTLSAAATVSASSSTSRLGSATASGSRQKHTGTLEETASRSARCLTVTYSAAVLSSTTSLAASSSPTGLVSRSFASLSLSVTATKPSTSFSKTLAMSTTAALTLSTSLSQTASVPTPSALATASADVTESCQSASLSSVSLSAASATNSMSPEIPHRRDDELLGAAVQSALGVAAVAASVVAASAGLSVSRLSMLLGADPCASSSPVDDVMEGALSVVDSPLQLSLGAPYGGSHRGAVVGNISLWISLCMAAVLLSAARWGIFYWFFQPHAESRDAGAFATVLDHMAAMRMPGVLFPLVAIALQQQLTSSLLLLLYPSSHDGSLDSALGVIGLFSLLLVCLAVGMCLGPSFSACALLRDLARHPGNRSQRRFDAAMLWLMAEKWQWVPSSEKPSFVQAFGYLFEANTPRRHWWLLVEVAVTLCCGVVEGIVPTTEGACRAVSWTFFALFLSGLLVSVVLQPFQQRIEFFVAVVLWALQVCVASLKLAGTPRPMLATIVFAVSSLTSVTGIATGAYKIWRGCAERAAVRCSAAVAGLPPLTVNALRLLHDIPLDEDAIVRSVHLDPLNKLIYIICCRVAVDNTSPRTKVLFAPECRFTDFVVRFPERVS